MPFHIPDDAGDQLVQPFVKRYIKTVALLLAPLAGACTTSTAPTFTGTPPLPEGGSVQADLALFLEFEGSEFGTNFAAALQTVTDAHNVTAIHVPFASFLLGEAQDEVAVSQSDGYHWLYSVLQGGLVADVDVRGRARGNVDAVWDLTVTSSTTDPTLSAFVILSGVSDLFGTEGRWRLFDHLTPSTPTPLLDIAWYNSGEESWRVTFINVRTGDAALGDYLDFESVSTLRRVTYFDESSDTQIIIDWDADTGAGQTTFSNGSRACWDAMLQNIVCGL
jgi:hypothetical protein